MDILIYNTRRQKTISYVSYDDMEYKIISAVGGSVIDACNKLEEWVKFCLRNGWQPQGGISVTPTTFGFCYACQAMIKESQEEKN